MPNRDIVVIGASAGGVEALSALVKNLPPDLPAAIFVVLHVSPYGTSVLPKILERAGNLKALHPDDGETIQHGCIYIAPPDYHLIVHAGTVRVVRGPRENGHRPAVDPLFRSAAQIYQRRVIGVILSGTLDDGTAGLIAVKRYGGMSLVQDPEEAAYAGMPHSAIAHDHVDRVLCLEDLAAALVELTHEEVEDIMVEEKVVSGKERLETNMAELDSAALSQPNRPGIPAAIACPECNGSLYEIQDAGLVRFRCRVGHAYSMDSLLADHAAALEAALYAALRSLEESATLARRVAQRAHGQERSLSARQFEEQASDAERSAEVIRQVLLRNDLKNLEPHGERTSEGPPYANEVAATAGAAANGASTSAHMTGA